MRLSWLRSTTAAFCAGKGLSYLHNCARCSGGLAVRVGPLLLEVGGPVAHPGAQWRKVGVVQSEEKINETLERNVTPTWSEHPPPCYKVSVAKCSKATMS